MRHMVKGRQLSRDSEHREALRKNMVQSLFEHGAIETTLPKAKEVKALAEKMVTEARGTANPLHSRRKVIAAIGDRRLVDEKQDFLTGPVKTVIQKLFAEWGPKFKDRNGGYTRIIRLGKHRIGDGGDIVRLELVTESQAPAGSPRKAQGLRRKRAEKKRALANRLKSAKAPAAAPAAPEAPAAETTTA